jgi:hypothetical protein
MLRKYGPDELVVLLNTEHPLYYSMVYATIFIPLEDGTWDKRAINVPNMPTQGRGEPLTNYEWYHLSSNVLPNVWLWSNERDNGEWETEHPTLKDVHNLFYPEA